MSLREPQAESLHILDDLIHKLALGKESDLVEALEIVRTAHGTCTSFERDFVSLTFSLATGVGKTRLMGAFITYLFLEKGIRNFFVLAPNLTIYDKLIAEFSQPNHPKYVFKGIGEFYTNPPRIVTGDNYSQLGRNELYSDAVHINVFNISKINADSKYTTQSGIKKPPRIKRMSEYLGDSYFNYLSELNDLVLLMDESHHYRADRGLQVLNELKPILGLELTATPKTANGEKFKNVVFEYSLKKAMEDGFVKEPAVATRKDFNPLDYEEEELDIIKLEDGIKIHEETKVALDIYARENETDLVKPFVLVVTRNIEHAKSVVEMIQRPDFLNGYYADKVIEIHSAQSGEEKDENIAKLLDLEKPENKIEIVVHVNKLKEGWDVTNLYTIIPLRSSASEILTEQTMGRGLRLPYGKRVGNNKVDKLTIVAHDRFQAIIDEAGKPNSIIKQGNIITIDPETLTKTKEVVIVKSITQEKLDDEKKQIEQITNEGERAEALQTLEIKREIIAIATTQLNRIVKSVNDLTNEEVKKAAVENYKKKLDADPQQSLFKPSMVKEFEAMYETVVKEQIIDNIIEMPQITLQISNEVNAGFHDFDLDVSNLNYQAVEHEILVRYLREEDGLEDDVIEGQLAYVPDKLDNIIVNEVYHDYSEIDYQSQSTLLFKLAGQAMTKFKSYLKEEQLVNVVQFHKRNIGRFIYTQMMQHFYMEERKFDKPVVLPFTEIKNHFYSKFTSEDICDYRVTITPASLIPSRIFTGFTKTYHSKYKFDSKTEKDFAAILERDNEVLKWLRPANNQFRIYWSIYANNYVPDFIAETKDSIYMIETKNSSALEEREVKEKTKAAIEFCKYASEYNADKNGKNWKYILIPHDKVQANNSFQMLTSAYLKS